MRKFRSLSMRTIISMKNRGQQDQKIKVSFSTMEKFMMRKSALCTVYRGARLHFEWSLDYNKVVNLSLDNLYNILNLKVIMLKGETQSTHQTVASMSNFSNKNSNQINP